MKMFPKR